MTLKELLLETYEKSDKAVQTVSTLDVETHDVLRDRVQIFEAVARFFDEGIEQLETDLGEVRDGLETINAQVDEALVKIHKRYVVFNRHPKNGSELKGYCNGIAYVLHMLGLDVEGIEYKEIDMGLLLNGESLK